MKANSDKSKQSNKATRRVLAGVLCGASVLSLVLSLVMPPISQAIANDVQTVSAEETVMGGGSSSESADVDNIASGDAEKLNSDDAEGDEAGDDSQPEEQPKDESQAEDDEAMGASAVSSAEEAAESKEATTDITNAEDLQLKLLAVGKNQAASFTLTANIDYADEITLGNSNSKITLDLKGHKIKHTGNNSNKPLFSVCNGAEFTITDTGPVEDKITDSQPLQHQGQNLTTANYGQTAKMLYENDVPTKLTYYVTESSVDIADSTRTNETTYEHEVTINGAIVGTQADSTMRLINVYTGGTFNLQSGVLTTTENAKVGSLIYAEEGSIVNMSGGYVCGATSMDHGAGIELGVNRGKGATLNLTGGVIAGNYAPDGGGVYANGSTINMTVGTTGGTTGGTISGNGTFEDRPGYGAGICALGSNVTVSGGYVTNNNCQFNYMERGIYDDHNGNGCHGGGGIAAYNGGSLTIEGGYITGNCSIEAGGGIYAGAWNQALEKFTFSGGTIASNVAENSEGGGIRIAAPTVGEFKVPKGSHAYITNNTTNTSNDWGGGGVFVQGGSDKDGVTSARLKISNALITKNDAQGFGGGFAACPTGKTAITDTNGIAIFGNTDKNGTHRSGGTHEKTDDKDDEKGGEITGDFIKAGHQDLFLIRDSTNAESLPYIAAVTGQMLGGGAANWTGTIDGKPRTISKYDGAQAKYMIGLKSEPIREDMDAATAAASLFITGNRSNIHGGGIMTNGDVIAGSTTLVSVYPKMKLKGSKVLEGGKLKGNDFDFQLLKQNKIANDNGEPTDTVPSFDSEGNLHLNGCSVVDTVKNDINGIFTFDLGEVYAGDALVYYLVELPGDKDVAYNKTIYKIVPTVTEDVNKRHNVLDITYRYYKVTNVSVTTVEKNDGTGARTPETESAAIATAEGENTDIITLTNGATFTNTCFWIPKATKVVKGGEMKVFTLQLADNPTFKNAQDVKTQANGSKSQTLNFEKISYTLDDLTKGADSTGRSAPKAFPYYYYVHEKGENSTYPHYKFDQSVYRFKVDQVEPTDEANGTIYLKVTYMKGSVGSDGEWKPDSDSEEQDLTETSTPTFTNTFTNTYSTSLPLSGMSGVTLTYLAGAAVLCAAAAWMHIRRKANAKGGKRRE